MISVGSARGMGRPEEGVSEIERWTRAESCGGERGVRVRRQYARKLTLYLDHFSGMMSTPFF
jgi:hypothetical protein